MKIEVVYLCICFWDYYSVTKKNRLHTNFFLSSVLILGHSLFFPVNSLKNSLFSRENKIARLALCSSNNPETFVDVRADTFQSHSRASEITLCGVTGIINDNACV